MHRGGAAQRPWRGGENLSETFDWMGVGGGMQGAREKDR